MGQNSIRSNLSKEDIIAEIRMTLSADFENKKSIVVVEGEDDILFFNGKFDSDVEVKESFSGKHGVSEIVEYFSDNRVIGICDVDYDEESSCERIMYYDHCCMEMMIISNDAAFFPFCFGYYQGTKQPQEVRLDVLKNLKYISLYRKLNSYNNWGVNFRGISIANAFNKVTLTLSNESLLMQINSNNPALSGGYAERIAQVDAVYEDDLDLRGYLLITQGHDFINYFQVLCEAVRRLKGKSPGATELFRALVCSYRIDDFRLSELYQELEVYQNSHGLKILPA